MNYVTLYDLSLQLLQWLKYIPKKIKKDQDSTQLLICDIDAKQKQRYGNIIKVSILRSEVWIFVSRKVLNYR